MTASVLTPRPAATTMVLRDGADGIEVLLLLRSHRSVFVPGARVFPGGAVDAADHDPHPTAPGAPTTDEASERLGLDRGGLAYWVAALRECFEAAGILLARRAQDGAPIDVSDPAAPRVSARSASQTTPRPANTNTPPRYASSIRSSTTPGLRATSRRWAIGWWPTPRAS